MQAVQQLPLVLVDPLHVHVEHGGRVDFHLIFLLQEGRELQLVFLGGKKDKGGQTPSPQGPTKAPAFSPCSRAGAPRGLLRMGGWGAGWGRWAHTRSGRNKRESRPKSKPTQKQKGKKRRTTATVSVMSRDTDGGRQGEKTQGEGLFLGPKTTWRPSREAGSRGAVFLVMVATCRVWRAPGAPACLAVRLAALGRGSHATKQHATCRNARTGWTFRAPPVDELFLQLEATCTWAALGSAPPCPPAADLRAEGSGWPWGRTLRCAGLLSHTGPTCLTLATSLMSASSSTNGNSFFSWLRSVRKPSPIFCRIVKGHMVSARCGTCPPGGCPPILSSVSAFLPGSAPA